MDLDLAVPLAIGVLFAIVLLGLKAVSEYLDYSPPSFRYLNSPARSPPSASGRWHHVPYSHRCGGAFPCQAAP